MRRTILPFVIAACSAALPGQSWAKITFLTTPSPSVRRAGAMAFDGTANRLILFGGTAPGPGTILNETWSYNGTWSQLSPVGGAPARWGHQMVRDTAQNRLITFGGRSPTISGLANDTYRWTGTAWSLMPTPTAPSPRYLYGMTFDSVRNRVVLFGGRTLASTVAETWEFDGVTWTQVATPESPPPREEMALAFDTSLNRTVLFGGYDRDTDTMLGDTWEYDGTTWHETTPTVSPSPRFRMASAFDSVRKRVVIYGGFDGTNITTQTHEYTGSAWNVISGGIGSTYATEMYAAYDSQRRKFVTFGGVGAAFSNETWEYTGSNTALFGVFGEGCATSSGITEPAALTLPVIGQTYTLEWTNVPLATAAVITAHGLSNQQFSGIPLPFELSIIDLVGCHLLVSPDFVGFDLATGGTVTTNFAIPLDNSLANVSFYSQILIPDAGAPNGVGGASRGARAIFGN